MEREGKGRVDGMKSGWKRERKEVKRRDDDAKRERGEDGDDDGAQ